MITFRVPRAVLSLLIVFGMTALVAYMVYTATGFTRSPRMVPLVVGVPTLLFLIIQIVRDVRAVIGGDRTGGTASAQEADRYGGSAVPDDIREMSVMRAPVEVATAHATATPFIGTLWVLLLVALVWLVGLLVTIPVFVVIFMRFFGRESLRLSVAFAIGTSIFAYVFFVVLLEVQMAPGRFEILIPFL